MRKKTRAVGYCRTASWYSGIGQQRAAIKGYARRHGYELVDIFEDVGVPGTTATGDRPGFHQLVKLAESGEIDTVIVHRLDRIGYDLARVLPAVEWLRDQRVEIRSVTERIDISLPANAVFAVWAALGTDPSIETDLLRLVYDLRPRSRIVKNITAVPERLALPSIG